ncbi:hypothetical protein LRX76_06475 [Stenotrophomonas sp. MMGLT7]|nr:hypothetical protein [Stenotrophomonas sp. MMGLT7]
MSNIRAFAPYLLLLSGAVLLLRGARHLPSSITAIWPATHDAAYAHGHALGQLAAYGLLVVAGIGLLGRGWRLLLARRSPRAAGTPPGT